MALVEPIEEEEEAWQPNPRSIYLLQFGSGYAEPFRKVYVANPLGKAVSIIDVDKDEVVRVLRFNSEPGTPGYDAVAKRIYVTLRSTNEVAEIDPSTDRIIGRYPVEGCGFDHGMAIDSEHHRAFLLCGATHNLTVFGVDDHKAIAHFPIPTGADVVKFDTGNGRVYAACSSGAISIVQEDDPQHFRKIEDFPVQKLVHSLAVDPSTHRVYAPEQEEVGSYLDSHFIMLDCRIHHEYDISGSLSSQKGGRYEA